MYSCLCKNSGIFCYKVKKNDLQYVYNNNTSLLGKESKQSENREVKTDSSSLYSKEESKQKENSREATGVVKDNNGEKEESKSTEKQKNN